MSSVAVVSVTVITGTSFEPVTSIFTVFTSLTSSPSVTTTPKLTFALSPSPSLSNSTLSK